MLAFETDRACCTVITLAIGIDSTRFDFELRSCARCMLLADAIGEGSGICYHKLAGSTYARFCADPIRCSRRRYRLIFLRRAGCERDADTVRTHGGSYRLELIGCAASVNLRTVAVGCGSWCHGLILRAAAHSVCRALAILVGGRSLNLMLLGSAHSVVLANPVMVRARNPGRKLFICARCVCGALAVIGCSGRSSLKLRRVACCLPDLKVAAVCADAHLAVFGHYDALGGAARAIVQLDGRADARHLRPCGEGVFAPLRHCVKPVCAAASYEAVVLIPAVVDACARRQATAALAVLVPRAGGLADAVLALTVVVCTVCLGLPLRGGTCRMSRALAVVVRARGLRFPLSLCARGV